MRAKAVCASLAVVALVGLVSMSLAQGETRTIFKFSDLEGRAVRNPANESLGSIEDIVANMNDGCILYYAVSHGEVLGFGGKLYAVSPWAISLSDDRKVFVMDVTRDSLKNGTGFDANKWPNAADRNLGKPSRAELDTKVTDGSMVRLNRIEGMTVRSPQGEDLGKIHDFAVSPNEGKVIYAAISHGATLGVGGKLYAVPLNAIKLQSTKLDPTRREAIINISKADLERLQGFKSGDTWPLRGDDAFMSKK